MCSRRTYKNLPGIGFIDMLENPISDTDIMCVDNIPTVNSPASNVASFQMQHLSSCQPHCSRKLHSRGCTQSTVTSVIVTIPLQELDHFSVEVGIGEMRLTRTSWDELHFQKSCQGTYVQGGQCWLPRRMLQRNLQVHGEY